MLKSTHQKKMSVQEVKYEDLVREHNKLQDYVSYLEDQLDKYRKALAAKVDGSEDKKLKVYVSGPITNEPDFKKKFEAKQKELENAGYIVINPTWINAELSYGEYMRIDFSMIDVADCIYLMNGWHRSKGATLEKNYAEVMNKVIILEDPKGIAK